ncbi:MAG: HAD family phosphatase [Lachnospiraceae bacterium]|nr:HAD family phosphatase [Lachnospiraceae bacterium]
MIRNIIFDMGNVLLSYEPERFADELCRPEAVPVILRELFQGPDWVKQDLGLVGKKELYELVKVRVPEEMHPDLKNAVDNWSSRMKPMPGAKEFLQEMKAQGYKLFVLSNAGSDFYEYFARHYDLLFFDGVVISADLHIVKPDRRIYEYLLETYSLKAEECIFADDMPENVRGAMNCGIRGFLFAGDYKSLRNACVSSDI